MSKFSAVYLLPIQLCYCATHIFNIDSLCSIICNTRRTDEREHETSSIKYALPCNKVQYSLYTYIFFFSNKVVRKKGAYRLFKKTHIQLHRVYQTRVIPWMCVCECVFFFCLKIPIAISTIANQIYYTIIITAESVLRAMLPATVYRDQQCICTVCRSNRLKSEFLILSELWNELSDWELIDVNRFDLSTQSLECLPFHSLVHVFLSRIFIFFFSYWTCYIQFGIEAFQVGIIIFVTFFNVILVLLSCVCVYYFALTCCLPHFNQRLFGAIKITNDNVAFAYLDRFLYQ